MSPDVHFGTISSEDPPLQLHIAVPQPSCVSLPEKRLLQFCKLQGGLKRLYSLSPAVQCRVYAL